MRGSALATLAELDLQICATCNRMSSRFLLRLFVEVSRLGNGRFWYGLMILLPAFFGTRGTEASLRMLLVGVVCLALYRWIKRTTARPRPYQADLAITRRARALDPYAFPSGHTLHAVAFTLVVLPTCPELAWLLVPFTLLVAISRVVLGLHYPSDVLAGAALGATVALTAVQIG
jgi:undecaprenyl-diphosphatase